MNETAYTELAERLIEVTAERDRARATAAALEQQLADIDRLATDWEMVARIPAFKPTIRFHFDQRAADLREALNPEES